MRNILIVDDSPTMRRMVTASLRALSGLSFGEASSGLEAIERLALAPVDLMILDLNMPDMHGLEVLDFLRRHQAYSHIPVIVLTTRGDEASRAASSFEKPCETTARGWLSSSVSEMSTRTARVS
jgi:two-component system chemotaxis response regulator CheY